MSNGKTAVQWLVEQLPIRIVNSYQNEIIKVLEMEKQQIIDAANWDSKSISENSIRKGEQYYNETYNTNHE
jgi:hypothetical protein